MSGLNEFNMKNLQQKDIHYLRTLARNIGVASPTSKKKADLIDEIIAIVMGKSVPEYKNSNRGRPAKDLVMPFSYSKEYNTKSIFSEFESDAVASPSHEYGIGKKGNMVHGVVTKVDDEFYIKKFKFAETLDDAKLSDTIMKIYNLNENDVLTYTKNGEDVVVFMVNGKPALASGNIQINSKNITWSKRNIVFMESINEKREFLKELQNYGKVVFLPGNSLDVASNSKVTVMPFNISSDEEIVNNFCSAIDVCSYYKLSEGNTIFVADNLLAVLTAIKQFDEQTNTLMEHDVFSRIDGLVKNGITFIGFFPSSLKNIFTPNETMFDNIS